RGLAGLGRRSNHDYRDPRGLRGSHALAALAGVTRPRNVRTRAPRSALGHESHLGPRGQQLPIGSMPVPAHAGLLVAVPRPAVPWSRRGTFRSLDAWVFLSPGKPWADSPRPGYLEPGWLMSRPFCQPLAATALAPGTDLDQLYSPGCAGLPLHADRPPRGSHAPSMAKPVQSLAP